ncbi:MAG: excinuclease ABC subunit UvrA [Bacteroidia bacterium]|nr:excinuclease ABC subunit UvrA [Bacteroidia bacterium]MCF8425624.1 excinuclease ABC subunit UvrA [Bacteroidia bacterium]MCF8445673.1 excinuclease ABC subunit UvrA [Bacteroidia bacterium]
MQDKNILIKGARMHNLKNVSVAIERNKLTIVTGVSGSGKSSLVFDTLYAEGQRRYVESLSAYARQFLGKMNKPDVDTIQGISPSIAIEQKVNTKNPRSTVATSTEIYDYLKLLFARIGVTYSPISGKEVIRHTVEFVTDHILSYPESTRMYLLVALNQNGPDLMKELELHLQNGFNRIFLENEIIEIEDYLKTLKLQESVSPKKKTAKNKESHQNEIFLMVDRFAVVQGDEDFQNRISDSVQTAFFEGHGELTLMVDTEVRSFEVFNNKFEVDGITFEEPSVNFFSFNNPYGACKTCEGFGSVIGIDEDLVIPDKSLSIFEDAIVPWKGEKMQEWKIRFIAISRKNDFPIHKPYYELTQKHKNYLWQGGKDWEGINGFFHELEKQTYKIQYRVMLARYRGKTTCMDCMGTRLRKDANNVMLKPIGFEPNIAGSEKDTRITLSELILLSIDDCYAYFESLELNANHTQISKRILQEIQNRLSFLKQVGLGYLSLNRLSNSLSGGESQRINLATSLGSSLVGSLYILDEPSIGLHSRDTEKLIGVLKRLRDIGNTVVVVEHDQDIMEQADHIIDMGPLAGIHGGEIVAKGTLDELRKDENSLTGKYLSHRESIPLPERRRKWNQKISLKGARQNNLKGFDVDFPLNVLTVVTGVSGSGKTTLIKSILYPALQKLLGSYSGEKTGSFDKLEGNLKSVQQIEFVDQNPIGKSSRSNPVTYVKAYDAIRELYSNQPLAKHRHYKPQHFSFNVEGGRCDTCQGEGEITIEMQFMADVHLPCEECGGTRFKEEVREVQYKNKSISDVLNLSIDEALEFFVDEKTINNKLKPLQDVGLGYIKLGQSSNTLSGGEAQRVKLATFLGKGKNSDPVLFIFDEPTTGLHFHDIKKLLNSFYALLDQGHSILVIEHNMEVIKCADWIIDLGPVAGNLGGNLVFTGTPEDMIKTSGGYTVNYLKQVMEV